MQFLMQIQYHHMLEVVDFGWWNSVIEVKEFLKECTSHACGKCHEGTSLYDVLHCYLLQFSKLGGCGYLLQGVWLLCGPLLPCLS